MISYAETQTYIITHEHQNGVDVYTVRCRWYPEWKDVVEALGIDFEPHKGESITIDSYEEFGAVPSMIRTEDGEVEVVDEGFQDRLNVFIDIMRREVNERVKGQSNKKASMLNALTELQKNVNAIGTSDLKDAG
ncbi:hypothetical protein [Pseudodesulfovibrio pelocollis]|uniref:hypothetical protein n=1 Tax=Pseudodesulfovibrio pelocollis TaxID=3051432 RepID=UPI00255AD159|nr:hypothetical protein [Pseudodesulfovibrio sp. SB368]